MNANDTALDVLDWSTVSEGWDVHRDHVEQSKEPLTDRLLMGLALQPGENVLELGAGTGELARQLAEAVGPDGRVLATDVADGMVALIEQTTSDLPAVHAARIDASDIGHRDELFDAVVFRMGLMFVPRPAEAMTEIRRVLRPGGRLAVTTWAGAQDNMWLAAVGMSSMIHGIISGPMPTEPGGPLSLTDPEVLETLTRVAGFDDVSVEAVDIAFCTADVDEQLAHVTSLSPPIAAGFAAATIDQRAAVRASVAEMIAPFRTDDGYAIPGKALLLEAH